MRLLPGIDNLEHLLLTNTLNLRQGHGELGRLLRPLVLNSAGQSLRIRSLGAVKQVLREGRLGGLAGRG